jgi:hypothetical protein
MLETSTRIIELRAVRKLARQQVRLVIAFSNGFEYALAVFGFNGFTVIEHARNGRDGNASQPGDF